MGLPEAAAALLILGPAHGYELITILAGELGPIWEVRPSNLYLILGRMERDELIERERVAQDGKPDRQLLKLTPEGRATAARWLSEPGSVSDFLLKIAVARVVDPDRMAGLASEMARLQAATLAQLRALRSEVTGGLQAETVDLEIGLTQARLRWLSAIRDRAPALALRPRGQRRGRQREDDRSLA